LVQLLAHARVLSSCSRAGSWRAEQAHTHSLERARTLIKGAERNGCEGIGTPGRQPGVTL